MTMSRSALPAAAAALALVLALSACVPEPEPAAPATDGGVPAGVPTPIAPASPDATPTATALPADCAAMYSDAMRTRLEADLPPLNDPGISMYSTQNATLLELLDAVPTLRCTWGPPSDTGIATNLSLVTAEQSAAIVSTLTTAGFGCEDADGATVCRIEQRGVDLDDREYSRGETHALEGELWVATAWLNYNPEGYSEDILATVGG